MAKYVTVQVTRREPPAPVEPTGPQCKKCRHGLQDGELEKNLHICPYCGYHYPMPAHSRVSLLADAGSVSFIADELRPADPLGFFDKRPYPERFIEAQRETGLTEAMLAALCTISGHSAALGVMDFKFMGGSMGSVLGERFYRLAQAAIADRRAFIVVASSGGARMQEGLFSLMQMAKTVTAARLVGEAGLPYITVLTHPTTGGVFASFATVADIMIAEPGAVMQFAGSRIIEQTTREKLPPDFGTSEKQLAQGQIDMVVHRLDLKDRLAQCLDFLEEVTAMAQSDKPAEKARSYTSEALRLLQQLQELRSLPTIEGYTDEIKRIQERLHSLRHRGEVPSPWDVVQLARHQDRPQTLDYIAQMLPDFVELKGDRMRGDDSAIVGGMGTLGGRRIVLVGHQKGHTLDERQERSFGMARPEGYRKAIRLARLAEKFGLPLVTLVDTGGAYPGKDAEEGGQAAAIATSILTFTGLKIPTVTVVIGEGGSGGALALAVCDRVLMLENSIYSVISPEGCAALLWRDSAEGPKAAAALHLIAMDLFELGLIDGVIPEPTGGAHTNPAATAKRVKRQVQLAISELEKLDPEERLRLRHEKYLRMGRWVEPGIAATEGE